MISVEMKKEIISILEDNYCKVFIKDGELNYYEIEVYNDDYTLQDKTVENILSSKTPMDTFYETIDGSMDYEWEYVDESVNQVFYSLSRRGHNLSYEEKDDIGEYLRDRCSIVSNTVDGCLNESYKMNLITTFYDEDNYDFAKNSFYLDGVKITDKLGKGSITWLVNSQGYKMKDLYDVIYKGKKSDSIFLNSLANELSCATYIMNVLTFLLDIELGDAISIVSGKKDIVIETRVMCGLYNPFNGSGSMLEIELEKPVTISHKNIWSLNVDGAVGYGIDSIYGLTGNCWRDAFKIIDNKKHKTNKKEEK